MLRILLLILLSATTACGSGNRNPRPRAVRDLITREELNSVQVITAYEAIQRLRPEYLRTRGGSSSRSGGAPIVVYVNGVRSGGIDYLRGIPATDVTQIRWISAADATTLHGTGHSGGVIAVTTGH
jgi:hypothetical protein